MDLAARVHALEILVEVVIETLPSEHRERLSQRFQARAEVAMQAMHRLPIPEAQREATQRQLDRLASNLSQIASA